MLVAAELGHYGITTVVLDRRPTHAWDCRSRAGRRRRRARSAGPGAAGRRR
ncbi:hypothetical protein [Streptomyces sp. NPDC058279]|uniref:hypothetical protein n=1 Tax=Streptomyces sp. NPDC058279 TaxID=3346418 RepID=UPI0036E2DBDE